MYVDVSTPDTQKVQVWVNDEIQEYCFAADDEAGYAIVFDKTSARKSPLDMEGLRYNGHAVKILTGKVQIYLPGLPAV